MKIISQSHLDHGLTAAQIYYIQAKFANQTRAFIAYFDLPEYLGTVPCGLHGPMMGDAPVPSYEVTMITRANRNGPSRMCGRPTRPTRTVTVIAGPHEGDDCVLYTAFGGPLAPKEPWETEGTDAHAESVEFWAEHALSK